MGHSRFEEPRIQFLKIPHRGRNQPLAVFGILAHSARLLDIEQGPGKLCAHPLQIPDAGSRIPQFLGNPHARWNITGNQPVGGRHNGHWPTGRRNSVYVGRLGRN